ncbi:UNVERIFIED_ORG: hypothetical protein BCL66_102243 [Martelella mediterranea]
MKRLILSLVGLVGIVALAMPALASENLLPAMNA